MHTKYKGYLGEFISILLLLCKGFRILKWRYKNSYGEIDIIAKKRSLVVFVEVKFREHGGMNYNPFSPQQLRRIRRSSEFFLLKNSSLATNDIRYDAILISKWHLPQHIENITI
jgi:putative endonuclease